VDRVDREARAFEEQRQVAVEVHAHREPVNLVCDLGAVDPFAGLDLEPQPLVDGVECDRAGAELPFASVRRATPLARRRPFLRQPAATLYRPRRPAVAVGVRQLVVEQQRPAGLQAGVQAAQPFEGDSSCSA
jgi:hypothetical protein